MTVNVESMDRTVVAWSGGKDAAFCLRRLLRSGADVYGLWTTVGESTDRSTIHGVRSELYRRQAAAIGLPIRLATVPADADNETYRSFAQRELERYGAAGIDQLAYGDLHLEGVRSFREETLSSTPLSGHWPLWGMDTESLTESVIDAGFEAVVVAIDADTLDTDLLGMSLSELVESRPGDIDPAGENGEYHTFVTDGPIFDEPLEVEHGRVVERDLGETTMAYLDLL